MIRCGCIYPSRSNFGSPVFLVPKSDVTLLMCIDYCTVNALSIKDRYPLPHIEDLLNSTHRSCWFTKLDLAAGYHEMCIATVDRQMTAFTTQFGLYEWRVLSFGLANAPSHFIRMINGILKPVKCNSIVGDLNNIMIHSRTLGEHVVQVYEVRTLLTERCLTAKPAN